jgi:hypothetical protein
MTNTDTNQEAWKANEVTQRNYRPKKDLNLVQLVEGVKNTQVRVLTNANLGA